MDALVSSHKGAPSEKLLPDIRFLRKYHQEARILRLLAQSLRALHYQVRANYIFFHLFLLHSFLHPQSSISMYTSFLDFLETIS